MSTFKIKFENVSDLQANKFAKELGILINEISPDVTVSQERADSRNQDTGTILQVVLGSGAAASIAKGIADWLKKRDGTSLEISDGKMTAKNISSRDAVRLTKLFLKAKTNKLH